MLSLPVIMRLKGDVGQLTFVWVIAADLGDLDPPLPRLVGHPGEGQLVAAVGSLNNH